MASSDVSSSGTVKKHEEPSSFRSVAHLVSAVSMNLYNASRHCFGISSAGFSRIHINDSNSLRDEKRNMNDARHYEFAFMLE